jgi:hypothetical protein
MIISIDAENLKNLNPQRINNLIKKWAHELNRDFKGRGINV